MNIAMIPTVASAAQQPSSNGVPLSKSSSSQSFGSVFSSIATQGTDVVTSALGVAPEKPLDAIILAIFNATSIEDLKEVLTTAELHLDGVEPNMANLLNLDREQLLTSLEILLEKVGLEKSELATLPYINDFWSVLNILENEAPQFFNQLVNALHGTGAIPKEQAIDLLVLFKTAALTAPKTDLLLRQEQQIFALQNFIGAVGEQFEKNLDSTNAKRFNIVQMQGTHHVIRFVEEAKMSQYTSDDGSQKEGVEASRNNASGVLGTVAAVKADLSTSELENRHNARNEALMREMQTIFKRSNFGQTGGTNRLLIKLYPEHLGQVRIELLQTNGIMTARILASTALGKEMLESQLNQLRNAFLQQNLQVERIDISQTLQDTSRSDRGQQSFEQQFNGKQEGSHEQQEHDPEDEMTFQEYMIELEV